MLLAVVPVNCSQVYTPPFAVFPVVPFMVAMVVVLVVADVLLLVHPVTAYTLSTPVFPSVELLGFPPLFKLILFTVISVVPNPYLLFHKYATAPHSLFFIK